MFLFHWREESQHAILDELEWQREDARLTASERDAAVDDLIALVGAVDGILQAQANADAGYFTCHLDTSLSAARIQRVRDTILKAYRWQYIVSGVVRAALPGAAVGAGDAGADARIQDALAPLAYAKPRRRPCRWRPESARPQLIPLNGNAMNTLTHAPPAAMPGVAGALHRLVAGLHWLRIAHAERRRAARARAELARLDPAADARPRPDLRRDRLVCRRGARRRCAHPAAGVRRPDRVVAEVKAAAWRLTGAATGLTALIAGSRASFGMFLSPLNTATGLGMASIALAAAFGQLAAGVALPVVEALARRFGAARVIAGGACLLALSTALLVLVHTLIALVFLMLVVFAAGTAVASNALLIGEVSRRAARRRARPRRRRDRRRRTRRAAAARAARHVRDRHAGLGRGAVRARRASPARAAAGALFRASCGAAPRRRRACRGGGEALRDPRFWLIAGSFAICGFHVAFLTVHMPGVIERCGLPASFTGLWLVIAGAANMAGSIGVGMLMKRFASAPLLALVYGLRVARPSPLSSWRRRAAPSCSGSRWRWASTYMATLPPTAELLARSFGVERLSSLLGAIMLVHQVGGFFGAWLGGVAVEHSGSYTPLWIADIALAAVATRAAVRAHARTASASASAARSASRLDGLPQQRPDAGARRARPRRGPRRSRCTAAPAARAQPRQRAASSRPVSRGIVWSVRTRSNARRRPGSARPRRGRCRASPPGPSRRAARP